MSGLQPDRARDEVVDRLGSLDVLVNAAGLGHNHPAEEVRESDWDEMMAVNLKGLVVDGGWTAQ